MYNTRANTEYSMRDSSWFNRVIAWKEYMNVADFIIPTNNPYLRPSQRYTVFYKGNLGDSDNVLVRVQSACVLGRILGFDDCDCQSQLLTSFRLLEKEQNGLFIYCNNDHGKGTGLVNHARTIAVEKFRGFDEDEARAYLGLKDARDYKPVVVIAGHFGIRSVRLLTNNASKLDAFRNHDIAAEQVYFHAQLT